MKKKTIIIAVIIILLILLTFFIKNYYKSSNLGNNMSNKSIEEIEKYISNIGSYEATATITIESNKNKNTYEVKQQYIKENNLYKQEFIAPNNLTGLTIIYDGKDLLLQNTKVNLTKIYENYPHMLDNNLSLSSFIQDYLESDSTNYYEQDNNVVLEAKIKNSNKYTCYKSLYIDKSSGNPTKLEIKDVTQKTLIYILYNEIKINNLQKEDILAFKLRVIEEDI